MELQQAESLWSAVRCGDVALLSGAIVLERAGYVRDSKGAWTLQAGYSDGALPQPLPNRQELEQQHTEAFLTASMLESIHDGFVENVKTAVNTYVRIHASFHVNWIHCTDRDQTVLFCAYRMDALHAMTAW